MVHTFRDAATIEREKARIARRLVCGVFVSPASSWRYPARPAKPGGQTCEAWR